MGTTVKVFVPKTFGSTELAEFLSGIKKPVIFVQRYDDGVDISLGVDNAAVTTVAHAAKAPLVFGGKAVMQPEKPKEQKKPRSRAKKDEEPESLDGLAAGALTT